MKKSFWLSYDLGLKGDYEGLYTFLDNLGAVECVNNLAYFTYDCKTKDYPLEIKKALGEHVNLGKNDRIYITWRSETGSILGRFLFGGRKRSPWEGYGSVTTQDESDVAQ